MNRHQWTALIAQNGFRDQLGLGRLSELSIIVGQNEVLSGLRDQETLLVAGETELLPRIEIPYGRPKINSSCFHGR